MVLALDPHRRKLIFNSSAAFLAASFTYYITGVLPYYPPGWRWLLIIAVALMWLFKPSGGLWFTLAIYILPIAYSSTTLAALYILLLIMFTGVMGPYGFFIFAAVTVTSLQPQLAGLLSIAPLMAGFLGARRGAALAALACFWAELLTLLRGKASIGLLVLGAQTKPLISLRTTPVNSLLNFAWLRTLTNTETGKTILFSKLFELDLLSKLFTPFIERPILLAQIVLWAVAAGVIGSLLFRSQLRNIRMRLIAVGSGVLILFAGHLILPALLVGSNVGISKYIFSFFASAILVVLASPVLEIVPKTLSSSLQSKVVNEGKRLATVHKEIPSDKWDELAGIDKIKNEIEDAINSQFNPKMREVLLKMSIKPTRGILLFGPPGTGKTKLARIIAHEAKAAFFAVSGTEFTSKWYGESEANLRHIFEEAQHNRPSVLFFDEMEAFLPKRTELSRSDAPEKGIVATFLAYTDGIGDLDGVLLVGATNYPDLIDPAVLRPGRFDKLIYISPPGADARYRILKRYLKGKPLAADVDLHKLAEQIERFTGADIQSVCTEVMRRAVQRGGRKPEPITMSDLETAIGGIKPSVTFKMLHKYEALADQYRRLSKKIKTEEIVAKPVLGWNDVVGLKNVKEALQEAIEMPLTHPELLKEYNIKPSKGVLLFGPPGCGKTFLAKVVASEAKAHFLHVKGPELLQQVIGKSEAQLRDLFIRARENAPCILFFDEIDALTGARGTENASGTKILAQFLTEMDGVEELKGVIVVAATNRPDMIDSALMRPGRLDRVLYVPPPDHAARMALFKKELANRPVTANIDYKQLADTTKDYSAADITAICNTGAMAAARDTLRTGKRQLITMQGLQHIIKQTPGSLTSEQLAIYKSLRDKLQR
ncbi:MAG: AAA family ATPase [Nitrospiraceae bacterium]|nr:AAA family ATPase [Nitrospiraceae bacterium]